MTNEEIKNKALRKSLEQERKSNLKTWKRESYQLKQKLGESKSSRSKVQNTEDILNFAEHIRTVLFFNPRDSELLDILIRGSKTEGTLFQTICSLALISVGDDKMVSFDERLCLLKVLVDSDKDGRLVRNMIYKDRVDLHNHTYRSDGMLAVTHTIFMAWFNGLRTVAITDHNTFDHMEEAVRAWEVINAASADDQFEVIPGIEININIEEFKHTYHRHLLAYFPIGEGIKGRETIAEFLAWLESVKKLSFVRQNLDNRIEWKAGCVKYLMDIFQEIRSGKRPDFGIDPEFLDLEEEDFRQLTFGDFDDYSVRYAIHLKFGYPYLELSLLIKKIAQEYYVRNPNKGGIADIEETLRFLYLIDGVVIMAHPEELIFSKNEIKLFDSASPEDRKRMMAKVLPELAAFLKKYKGRVDGLEIYHPRNHPDLRKELLQLLGNENKNREAVDVLLVSCGSDYHSMLEKIRKLRDRELFAIGRPEAHSGHIPEYPATDYSQVQGIKNRAKPYMADSDFVVVCIDQPYSHRIQDNKITEKSNLNGSVPHLLHNLLGELASSQPAARISWVAPSVHPDDFDPGIVDKKHERLIKSGNRRYILKRVRIREEDFMDMKKFLNGFLWPILHMTDQTSELFKGYVDPNLLQYWANYKNSSVALAEAAIEKLKNSPNPLLQVHDFELFLVANLVRKEISGLVSLYFHHITWPEWYYYQSIPKEIRQEILNGLLGNDIINFHSHVFARNFIECIRKELGDEVRIRQTEIEYKNRKTQITVLPCGIDTNEIFSYLKTGPEEDDGRLSKLKAHINYSNSLSYCVSVDRADYTKGILQRLKTIECLFDEYPELIQKMRFIQVLSEGRQYLPAFSGLIIQIQEELTRINEKYQQLHGVKPVILIPGIEFRDVLNLYILSDTVWVNSLIDGLPVIPKEYVAARTASQKPGVVVLSKYGGCATEFEEAILIDPFNIEETAQALKKAYEMPREEKEEQSKALFKKVSANNLKNSTYILLRNMVYRRAIHISPIEENGRQMDSMEMGIDQQSKSIKRKHPGISVGIIGAKEPTKPYNRDIGIRTGRILKKWIDGKGHIFTGGVQGVGVHIYEGICSETEDPDVDFFVLIPDDGTEPSNGYNKISPEKGLSVEHIGKDDFQRQIGMGKVADVLVVINGGAGTLNEALNALINGVPLIVLDCGGAGSLLYNAKKNKLDRINNTSIDINDLEHIYIAEEASLEGALYKIYMKL